ncbi:hypothetical protein L3X38_014032 [Prunus dulcis]|uniref:Nucleolar complex protein 2 homolog n=1 Tax=Prunus dulcis TaxID=3755 RepID=A0AAD4WN02_PRUDU|nr:hypothetical protein L3X38_014032 [Prunus dulcis]
MGKLGKKARKFSKKNLQSVLRRNRKLNSKFNKKKTSKRGGQEDTAKEKKKDAIELSDARNTEAEYIEDNPLDAIFSEDDSDVFGDDSDSDGYLSEGSSRLHLAHSENENSQEGSFGSSSSALSVQNSEIQLELVKKTKKLDKLKEKDPDFSNFLKSYHKGSEQLRNKVYADEDEISDEDMQPDNVARIRASMTFFVAFPSLLRRVIKIAVHLWATGRGTISSLSFLIIRDVASVFRSDCFDTCFVNTYKSFIGHCQFLEPVLFQHIQFLRNSCVELCSVDLQKASRKASMSIQQLAKILKQGLLTKKKEAVKKICSWQYTSCIDLWVMFISANIHDYDLHPLLFTIIQIINGVAVLFSGPRYLPLRIKCIQWLNHLSSSTGIFIPVASMVLDILEYKIGKDVGKPGKDTNILCSVKFPKHWLKSRNFQEQCVLSVIELLAAHFAQWSHHISFPDLATIPLVRLRKFHEITTIESFKRIVKRFIDQVEQNIEFVRKKRDEVPFSPKDQQSVESFLQLEKHSGNPSFTQYYKSIMDKAVSRNLAFFEKFSEAEGITKKAQKKIKQSQKEWVTEGVNGRHSGKRKGTVSVDGGQERKMRRKEKS